MKTMRVTGWPRSNAGVITQPRADGLSVQLIVDHVIAVARRPRLAIVDHTARWDYHVSHLDWEHMRTLNEMGIPVGVVGDSLIADLIWCPPGASPERRTLIVEALANQAYDEAERDRGKRALAPQLRSKQLHWAGLQTYSHLVTYASKFLRGAPDWCVPSLPEIAE